MNNWNQAPLLFLQKQWITPVKINKINNSKIQIQIIIIIIIFICIFIYIYNIYNILLYIIYLYCIYFNIYIAQFWVQICSHIFIYNASTTPLYSYWYHSSKPHTTYQSTTSPTTKTWTKRDQEPTWWIYSSFLLILGRRSAAVNNRHWSDLFNWWRLNSHCVRAILQQGWQTKAELTTRNRYYVGQGLWLTLTDVHFSKLEEYQALIWMPMGFMTQGIDESRSLLFSLLCRF